MFTNPSCPKGCNPFVGAVAKALNRSPSHISRILSGERRGARKLERAIVRLCVRKGYDIDFSNLGWL